MKVAQELRAQPQHRQAALQGSSQRPQMRAQRFPGMCTGGATKGLPRGASSPGSSLNDPQEQPPSTAFQADVVTAVFLA